MKSKSSLKLRSASKIAITALAPLIFTALFLVASCNSNSDDVDLAQVIAAAEVERNKPKIEFNKQPSPVCVQKGEAFSFDCEAALDDSEIYYRWFECDEKGKSRTPLTEWSLSSSLEPAPFTKKSI